MDHNNFFTHTLFLALNSFFLLRVFKHGGWPQPGMAAGIGIREDIIYPKYLLHLDHEYIGYDDD